MLPATRLALLAAALLASGCHSATGLLCAPRPQAVAGDVVEVRALGGAGWAVSHGRDVLLTAPLFSNPALLDVGLGTIAPDRARADCGLEPIRGLRPRALLVGHGHHDHLLDVPYVWQEMGRPWILANRSATSLLAATPAGATALELESVAAGYDDDDPDAGWRCIGRGYQQLPWACRTPAAARGAAFRVLALVSQHSPQIEGHELYASGTYGHALRTVPSRACDWRPGQTLAWLIDVLDDDGRTVFRVHYSDSPHRDACGMLPRRLDAGQEAIRAVDLALLTGGGVGTWLGAYPDELRENARPGHVLTGHWEWFFESNCGNTEPRALDGVEAFVTHLRRSDPEACLPVPGARETGRGVFRYGITPARTVARGGEKAACPALCANDDGRGQRRGGT